MWAFLFPSMAFGQFDTLDALEHSQPALNPNSASPKLKSQYFLAEAKYQEEAFFESQQLFQKLVDSFQKSNLASKSHSQIAGSNPDAQFISGAYYRLSQLSAREYPQYLPVASVINQKNAVNTPTQNLDASSNVTPPSPNLHKVNLDAAQYQINLALHYAPNNIDYLYYKAQLLEKTNQWALALKIYEALCGFDPHSWTFHEKTANAYFEFLPEVFNGSTVNQEKSKQKNSISGLEQQKSLLTQFQAFTDSWEKHFSLSAPIVETHLYILWCKEMTLQPSGHLTTDPNNTFSQRYNSMIPTRIQVWMAENNYTHENYQLKRKSDAHVAQNTQGQDAVETTQNPNEQEKEIASNVDLQAAFLTAMQEQNWNLANQLAESLENTLPIFGAKDLVKGFQFLASNQIESAIDICKSSSVETNPFILQIFLLLDAKSRTQKLTHSITSNQKFTDPLTSSQSNEIAQVLEIWIKLYNFKQLNQPDDIKQAIFIAEAAKNQEWIGRFQQLASDLNTSPSKPKQK